MSDHCSFVHNANCEYAPCHKGWEQEGYAKEQLNCLFCYCPMYQASHCLGSPQWISGRYGERIKDCSNCIYPHILSHYENIMQFMAQPVISLPVTQFEEKMWEQFFRCCGFPDNMGEERAPTAAQKEQAKHIYDRYFKEEHIVLLIKNEMQGQRYALSKEEWENVLRQINVQEQDILDGYLMLCHAPQIPDAQWATLSLLEQYFAETLQTAMLDAVRITMPEWLQDHTDISADAGITPAFGPGYYGISMENISAVLQNIPYQKAGITLKNGTLYPGSSVLCYYLLVRSYKDSGIIHQDCEHCLGKGKHCEMCMAGSVRKQTKEKQ